VFLYRETQAVRRGKGDALLGEEEVMDKQDGEDGCDLWVLGYCAG
jgi:hypothetical protein